MDICKSHFWKSNFWKNLLRNRHKSEVKGPSIHVAELVQTFKSTKYCELGCNWGHTAETVAAALTKGSQMHLFDYDSNIEITKSRMSHYEKELDIFYYPNSFKERDNYCWNLAKLIDLRKQSFDFVFIDGSHDFTIDGLAFFLCDLLLEENGIMYFDDLDWSFDDSSTINRRVHPKTGKWYTDDQTKLSQNNLFCNQVVANVKRYKKLGTGLYQKVN